MRTSKQISASIKATFDGFTKKADEIQALLVEVAGHMVANKEPSLGKKILNSAGNTKHGVAIAHWLAEFTVYSQKDGEPRINETRWKEITNGRCTNEHGQNVEAAEDHMRFLREDAPNWYDEPQAEEKKAAIFDALVTVENLLAKIATKVKKGEGEHLDLERYLRNALEQYKADRAIFETMKEGN